MGSVCGLLSACLCLVMQIHFAEEWNELHHLQIMESLGGDQYWIDRFAAQHAAVFYYWVLVFFFAFSPELAYVFSELVEVSRSLGCLHKMHLGVVVVCRFSACCVL